ncbi:MAG: 50S ribosomal protein L24 [Candidatus Sungbacteria bacterium]|nr:50S ribosomal protein L24 [bacterium]MDZ4260446.1 50S ribosomal protein L24 [Candidatus Sungbacteria bacterium]
MKIKKGDSVQIVSGNDKGKHGKVITVFPVENRIVVEGLNIKKKHVRPRKQGQKGELVKIPGSFSVSRAMIVCPKCDKPSRIKFGFNDAHKKMRLCVRCGSEL